MSNYVKFPFILPFKWVPNTSTPGSHFDDSWTIEQIKSWQTRACYFQKWVKSETTTLQIESTIAPDPLAIYDLEGNVKKTIAWAAVFTGPNYQIYELTFDISDLPEGKYCLYQRVGMMAIEWKALTEPIWSKSSWPNTMGIVYRHSFNKDGIAWTTGLSMRFRVECAIMDMDPEADVTSYINQVRDTVILDGTAARKFKFYIGEAAGVSPYIVDILNRIFTCDSVSIDGKLYARESGSKWEVNRVKGYPLVGASLDIVEAKNLDALQFSDTTPLAPGIVVAYNIETAFFGPGSLVPVTDVEEQG